jgi:hypothetical protein
MMRREPTPLHSAREREQLLSATRILAILLLALALTLVSAHALSTTHRGWQWFGAAVAGAMGLCALHAYLVRGSQAAFRWSLVALVCLSAAPLVLAAPANPTPVAGSLSLAALVGMLLSIQASRPSLRASVIDAIGKDIEARMARARALGFAETEEPRAL